MPTQSWTPKAVNSKSEVFDTSTVGNVGSAGTQASTQAFRPNLALVRERLSQIDGALGDLKSRLEFLTQDGVGGSVEGESSKSPIPQNNLTSLINDCYNLESDVLRKLDSLKLISQELDRLLSPSVDSKSPS